MSPNPPTSEEKKDAKKLLVFAMPLFRRVVLNLDWFIQAHKDKHDDIRKRIRLFLVR